MQHTYIHTYTYKTDSKGNSIVGLIIFVLVTVRPGGIGGDTKNPWEVNPDNLTGGGEHVPPAKMKCTHAFKLLFRSSPHFLSQHRFYKFYNNEIEKFTFVIWCTYYHK